MKKKRFQSTAKLRYIRLVDSFVTFRQIRIKSLLDVLLSGLQAKDCDKPVKLEQNHPL